MKKGVQMYTVRDYLNSREEVIHTLEKIKGIGYEAIQGGISDCMTLEEYKSICSDIGLENCSVYGDYEEMLTNQEAISRTIKAADAFGLKDIAIGTLPVPLRESKEGYYQFAEGINKIAQEMRKEGKRLLYHPHALEFFSLGGGLKGMDIILSETDPEGLHFSLDTHWLASAGVSVTDWIRKSAGRMSVIHFKDYAIVGEAQTVETVCRDFAEVGEGNIDWAGKHVYSEKMIAVTVDEAKELLLLAEKKGHLFTVAPDTFLGGGWQTARQLIDQGIIGDIVSIYGVCVRSYQEHGEEYQEPKAFVFGAGGGIPFDMGGIISRI